MTGWRERAMMEVHDRVEDGGRSVDMTGWRERARMEV